MHICLNFNARNRTVCELLLIDNLCGKNVLYNRCSVETDYPVHYLFSVHVILVLLPVLVAVVEIFYMPFSKYFSRLTAVADCDRMLRYQASSNCYQLCYGWGSSWQPLMCKADIITVLCRYRLCQELVKWATTWQNQQSDCVPSEDSDQPGHTQSDQSSLCAQWVAKDPSFIHAHNKDSDQTWRMPRLSLCWAHSHFVGFVMSRLKSWYWRNSADLLHKWFCRDSHLSAVSRCMQWAAADEVTIYSFTSMSGCMIEHSSAAIYRSIFNVGKLQKQRYQSTSL